MINSEFSLFSFNENKYLRIINNGTLKYLPISIINNNMVASLLIDDTQLADKKYFDTNVMCIITMKKISTYLNFEILSPINTHSVGGIQTLKFNFKLNINFIVSNLM